MSRQLQIVVSVALLFDITSLLLLGFENCFNYGIYDHLPSVSTTILCGFLQPTKFKII